MPVPGLLLKAMPRPAADAVHSIEALVAVSNHGCQGVDFTGADELAPGVGLGNDLGEGVEHLGELLGLRRGLEEVLATLGVGTAGGRTHPVTGEILTNEFSDPGTLFTMFNSHVSLTSLSGPCFSFVKVLYVQFLSRSNSTPWM